MLTGYPSIDEPWLKYYSKAALDTKAEECTVYRSILHQNQDNLNKCAMNYYGKRITYAELFNQIDSAAKSLKALGVKVGDCVTLCTSGCPEAIYIAVACSKIGAIANFLNPLFSKDQMKNLINDTNSKYMFVMDEMIHFIQPVIEEICVKTIIVMPVSQSMKQPLKTLLKLKQKRNKEKYFIGNKKMEWDSFIEAGFSFKGETEAEYEKDRPAVMVYSSGTTGTSKGIVLTNNGINETILYYISPDFPHTRTSSMLQIVPVWFSTGIILSILMPLCLGIEIIPVLAFSKENFSKALKKYKPTMTITSTSLWLYAIHDKKLSKVDFSGMRYPITGGEALKVQDENAINNFFSQHGSKAKLLKGYGMCELGSSALATSLEHSKIGAAGFPVLHTAVSAFDVNTNKELKYGERGEIRVNSPSSMKYYYNNEKATLEFFHTDEHGRKWGCTGDIGYVDEDGYVYICGRSADHFTKADGSVAFLFDSETILLKDDSVAQCKTVMVDFGEEKKLCTHIVLTNPTEDTYTVLCRIKKLCQDSLPADEVPQGFKIREDMPVHINGKRNNEALALEKDGYIFP